MQKIIASVLLLLASASICTAEEMLSFEGATCSAPPETMPTMHCPDTDCPAAVVVNQGPVVEMETRRTYFLDYPCDLKKGEPVTFILALHGGGSYGNWQRHYFPLMDVVNQYRLVVATPNSPTRVWTEADDQYLENIVNDVVGKIGENNVRAFWLVGHSQGGMTSNRILRMPFFKDRVDGWLSLSGGRLGGNPERAQSFGRGVAPPPSTDPEARERARNMMAMFQKAAALLATTPDNDISFIYTTGEREVSDAGVPATSSIADALGCGTRSSGMKVTDTVAGYVYDGTRQDPPNPSWGLLPAPGDAMVYQFPDCRDDRVVADVVRLKKGHTEGLEPNAVKRLVELMVSAPGGRLPAMSGT